MPTIKFKLKDPKYCLLVKSCNSKKISVWLKNTKSYFCLCYDDCYCRKFRKRLINKPILKGKYKGWSGVLRPQACIDKFGE